MERKINDPLSQNELRMAILECLSSGRPFGEGVGFVPAARKSVMLYMESIFDPLMTFNQKRVAENVI